MIFFVGFRCVSLGFVGSFVTGFREFEFFEKVVSVPFV